MSVLEAAHQKQHGTTDKDLHYYAAYGFHFSSRKRAEITLLEMGVQNGGSLWTWAQVLREQQGLWRERHLRDRGPAYFLLAQFGGRPGAKDTCIEFLKTRVDKLHGWALRSPRAEPFQVSSETDDLE